jgi:hypothetical protein
MVKFNLTVNKKQRTAYFNRKIVDSLGYELLVQLNATSGVIYPKDAEKEDIIRSVEILLADLKHQARLEEKGASNDDR